MIPFLIEGIHIDLDSLKKEIDTISEWNWKHSYIESFYKKPDIKLELGSYYLWDYCQNPIANPRKMESASSRPTSVWKNFPTVFEIEKQIPGETDIIKIMKLGPGSVIPAHREWLATPHRKATARFHIPIYTHSLCTFKVTSPDKEVYQICTEEGTLWYLHSRWEHEYVNHSSIYLINLIIDKQIDYSVKLFTDTLMPL